MAEISLIFLQSSLIFVLTKLEKFLKEEVNLPSSTRSEAEYINKELKFIMAFLRGAEKMEDSDAQLKEYAKELRAVAYDIEDILDDFKLHLTRNHMQGSFFASPQKFYHFIKSLKPLHQINSSMQDIKRKLSVISEIQQKYPRNHYFSKQDSSFNGGRHSSRREDIHLHEEANPVGIENPKKNLTARLFESTSDRQVVSVVGMGGLGKTTLVREVYNDDEVKKQFQFHAWFTLSPSFTTEDFIKDIIQQLSYFIRRADPQGLDSMLNVNLRKTIINEFLKERKYLIVFDNVSDITIWASFEHLLPNNGLGSRILLTTRNLDVASASTPENVYNLNPLDEKESWTLFCWKIFQNQDCPPNLKDVLQKILARCRGLPLAIVAIGGVLARKHINRIDEWESVLHSLGPALQHNTRLNGILSLSYDDLPYYLKYCLLYFSIFPVGSPIEQAKLVRLWIAEGFVEEKEGMTLEEVADEYLKELIKRSLVQVVEATSDGRVKTCSVHDILLEIIIVKSKGQEFVTIAHERSMTLPEKVRRLSIHNVDMPNIACRLRSLLTFYGSDSLPESLLLNFSPSHLRLLNVLDLGGTPLQKFPKKVVSLRLLKYLSLRNTKVNSIPSSIGNLQNLETLDLKHACVTELPAQILKLQKLRHILVYRYEIESDDQIHTKYGFRAPSHQIGGLQSIQKLCFLEANQGKELMIELGKLKQLRRLGIVKLKKEDGEILCSSIEKLRHLRALSITSVNEKEVIDIEKLSSTPRFLQRLYLTGQLEKLPRWLSSVDSLVKLVLKWSSLSEDPLPSLQHLPNLLHLEFVQVYDGESLSFQAQGFQRLKFLGLNKLDKLKKIIIEQGGMPCLEKLIIQSCGSLHRLPFGIEHLAKLKVLDYYNMPVELIMTLHPTGGGDYSKVEHVPEVYFTYLRDGKWDIFSLETFKSGEVGPTNIQHPRHIWK